MQTWKEYLIEQDNVGSKLRDIVDKEFEKSGKLKQWFFVKASINGVNRNFIARTDVIPRMGNKLPVFYLSRLEKAKYPSGDMEYEFTTFKLGSDGTLKQMTPRPQLVSKDMPQYENFLDAGYVFDNGEKMEK